MIFIMKTLSCRDSGFDCDYIIQGETEEDIFRNSGQHALNDHGIRREDFTPQFNEKLRGLIRDI
jgi:predicted small metal-binding protein